MENNNNNNVDYLQFQSEPSGRHKGKKHIIIVGAGIIGVCTAYFVVKHPKFDPAKYHITLIESKRVAGGASGKAGGLLALWAFPEQIVSLSFNLHQSLANEYNGAEEWGYRRLTTVSLEGDISRVKDFDDEEKEDNVVDGSNIFKDSFRQATAHDSDSSSSTNEKPPKKTARNTRSSSIVQLDFSKNSLPSSLNWINSSLIDNCTTLGGTDTTAQVHPYKFTNFILRKAVECSQGALELILGKVEEITYSEETGTATGVIYQPTSVKDSDKYQDKLIELGADQTVLTVGPWISKILPDCPISGLRAHSITIAPFKDQPVSPYAIFTELKVARNSYISPEIYARQDEVYVCGEGDSAVDVPETTDDVEVVRSKCDELYNQVSKISPNLKKGHILRRQACYLPVLDVPSSSGPLIGETNVTNLYLASGHSCWGINNAPGTGKIMSELLMDGKVKSADISSLDPSFYFDASVILED
ncbi:FAD dependent oxidoreductase family protein [Candida parapsilosis]|uniref:DAO domain-containing protein n=2 Tax=Candida parapsilosis TaxID=5480 RepID=G8BDR6_CANPC|nr:uncharacterized protein CPAR2_210570 [Candida parapsilosis]KAF6054438.1 FAD dependent oxidoreductase family protein [Candida parapsilosis]KAF6056538.1 FAD dependent oxidoreductase family protein [Candida parapsilosis]KAF6059473.1 FAD dependent oxidoreductase family protein [Candida parapsilosis]KAF6068226.1 FAD dependent oxidoreductase family protein [Candida parapsilosis]KAI5905004.1 putative oxidoreductase TDA3 [Candida parapsilosis]